MNGRERFLSALRLETPDLPPVFLRDLTLGLDQSGLTTPEVCAGDYDARKAAESVLARAPAGTGVDGTVQPAPLQIR